MTRIFAMSAWCVISFQAPKGAACLVTFFDNGSALRTRTMMKSIWEFPVRV